MGFTKRVELSRFKEQRGVKVDRSDLARAKFTVLDVSCKNYFTLLYNLILQ